MPAPKTTAPVDEEKQMVNTMQAIVQTEYGAPEVLRLAEVERPTVSEDEVLVRIHASSVDAGIWHLMRGTPFLIRLIYGGLRRPKHAILGTAVAGTVEAIGENVTQFQPGDEVFGELSESGFGGFAEYVAAPASAWALKPQNVTFEAAATVPVSGLAALQALRDVGHLQSGQKVLILGASGGVGSFAVQLAKTWGAEVTGVCSPRKTEMVRALGADHIIDYTQTEVVQTRQQYDLIVDAAAFRPFTDYLSALAPDGTYVMVGGSTPGFFQALLLGPLVSKFGDRQIKALTSVPTPADLLTLKELVESGQIKPWIDRTYPLREVPAAIGYLEQRQVQGKVAIRI